MLCTSEVGHRTLKDRSTEFYLQSIRDDDIDRGVFQISIESVFIYLPQ